MTDLMSKDATVYVTLTADSGYESIENHRVSAEHWGRIVAVLNDGPNTALEQQATLIAKARDEALEEAADWCDDYSANNGEGMFDVHSNTCANAIRALKGKTND